MKSNSFHARRTYLCVQEGTKGRAVNYTVICEVQTARSQYWNLVVRWCIAVINKYFFGHFSTESLGRFALVHARERLRHFLTVPPTPPSSPSNQLIFYPRVMPRVKRAFILAQYFTNFRPRSDVTIPKARRWRRHPVCDFFYTAS